MIDTEKRNKRQNDWIKKNTDRINFTMPRGYKKRINYAATAAGISAAEFIRRAIDKELKAAGIE